MGSLSATGREQYRQPFYPLVPGFVHVPFGDADAVAREMDEDTAGIIVEPIQGEGGIFLPPDDYLPKLRQLCNERDALLIVDEVQTGLGRTGSMFAVQHWGYSQTLSHWRRLWGAEWYRPERSPRRPKSGNALLAITR
jgi:putrescine aminotransferase